MKDLILETKELTKIYKGQTIVNKLNLQIKRGEIFGFLGPNGAGKTTSIRMMLGLIRPTSGNVFIFNEEFTANRIKILSKIGSLIEKPSYYPKMTGFENLEICRRILNIDDKKRVDKVLDIVKLQHAKDKKVKNYSLGMKQRLGIATSLINNPDFLILDEPTNGLDPEGIHEIRTLIKQMAEDRGITIMLSSHLLSEIEQIATNIGIINKGELLFQGSLDSIKKNNSQKLIIKVNETDRAIKILNSNNINCIELNKYIYIDNIEPNITLIVQRLLLSANITITHLEDNNTSLEKIYLDIVNKGIKII